MNNSATDPPEGIELLREFVNTHDLETGADAVGSPDELRLWLVDHALMEDRETIGPADLARGLELREALRALLRANAGHGLDHASMDTLVRMGRNARLRVSFDDGGRAELTPDPVGVDGALSRLLAIVFQAQADGSWPRLKACALDSCRWAFWDASKNRSRAWCSMAVCGNRSKTRSYRTRHTPQHPI